VCELGGSGGTTSVVATNTFGINGLVSRNDSSGTNFYAFDPQGSTAERVDSSGTLVSSDCYNAWGTASTTASAAVVFGYIAQWGYYTDAETGLVLCTHRYYDPAHGRWLTRDPIGCAGGLNVYAYCQDEPATNVDASGYCCHATLPWWLADVITGLLVGAIMTIPTVIGALFPEMSALLAALVSCLLGLVAGMVAALLYDYMTCKPADYETIVGGAIVGCLSAIQPAALQAILSKIAVAIGRLGS